jgi:hypothetical protein
MGKSKKQQKTGLKAARTGACEYPTMSMQNSSA